MPLHYAPDYPVHVGTIGAPFWPEQGQVLAGYWAAGLELPSDYAAVVEYPPQERGRGIVWRGGV